MEQKLVEMIMENRKFYPMYEFNCQYAISTNGFMLDYKTKKMLPIYYDGYRVMYNINGLFYYADQLLWKLFIGDLLGKIDYKDGNETNLNLYNLTTDLEIRTISDSEILINDVYFRKIPNFSKYYISQSGTVFSTKKRLLVIRSINHANYLTVSLVDDNGFRSPRKVHRLVYSTYCGELSSDLEIDHQDFNRHNCNYTNLRQVSTFENQYHVQNIKRHNQKLTIFEIESICKAISLGYTDDEALTYLSVDTYDEKYDLYKQYLSRLRKNDLYKSILKKYEMLIYNSALRGGTKLTKNDVDEIQKKYKEGQSVSSLSKIYNVSKVNIYNIINGKKWVDNTNEGSTTIES